MRTTSAELGGATWFGDTGSSLIDYVWAPAALPLRCSGPLRRMAAELQVVGTRQLRDHVPLSLEFNYVQLAGQPAPGEKEAWNADASMEGVRAGTGRRCYSFTSQTCWTITSTKFWSRRGSDSSRKNRWMRQVMQTWQGEGGSYSSIGWRPGGTSERILSRGRKAWNVRRSFSRGSEQLRKSWRVHQQLSRQSDVAQGDWKRRDLAATFRWSRLLGGRRWKAKKRDYRALSAALPSRKAWQDEWAKRGAEGGMGGSVLENWSDWRAQTRDLMKRSEIKAEVVGEAGKDMEELVSSFRTVKKRRACPAGSPPCRDLDDAPPRLSECVARRPGHWLPDEEN